MLPDRPSLEHLRKQAKDLLREERARNPAATLAKAQLAIARKYGLPSWPKLVHQVELLTSGGFVLRPLIRPVELVPGKPHTLPDGSVTTKDDVFAMFVAAREGDFSTVKRLVAAVPGLAIVEYNYTPPIHFAVREGHRAIAEFLLEKGADPAYRSYPFQESLLGFAEDRGHDEIAELLQGVLARRFALTRGTEGLLEAAAKGNLKRVNAELARNPALARLSNETGDTALHQAARHGHLHIVEELVRAGAEVDAVRADGWRPIHCALMPNWISRVPPGTRGSITDLLLARGARYTIFIAAYRGDSQYVKDGLARDSSLANFADTCHHRVLSAATRRNDVEMVRLLLEHGADPNLPEEGAPHGTALYNAVQYRYREIVRLLLARGADPNAEVESSGTPMLQAKDDPELFALLVAHGGKQPDTEKEQVGRLIQQKRLAEAEQSVRANQHWLTDDAAGWGDGILAGPARDGRNDVIDMLLRLGATIPTVSKWAPYYYFKHKATAGFLLDRGMDPNHMNWHRFTLLHHMAADDERDKARLLLDHGADLDAIDDEYRSTPLGIAARWGRMRMVKLFLERGADPTAAGAPWSLPLAWAEKKGHGKIAELLRSRLPGSAS
jgi:ankyrin repeat protein